MIPQTTTSLLCPRGHFLQASQRQGLDAGMNAYGWAFLALGILHGVTCLAAIRLPTDAERNTGSHLERTG